MAMGSRRSFVVMMIAATVVAGTATTAEAASGHTVATWEMNEPAGARTMADSSGHGLRGSIGGEVGPGVHVRGVAGYRFSRLEPDSPPPHPRHLVTVRDAADLDPGRRNYTVTVRLRTTEYFGNIIQKGQATVSGGSFKLQIPSGKVQCLFRGSDGQVIVSAPGAINDGWWHTVRCARTTSQLTLTVDGSVVARRSGRTGWIANSWPLSIGGKTSCDQVDVGCDYYAGDIDYVEITTG
jgi:hypothetical protein